MPSHPCFISTTAGRKAAGFRIEYGGRENLEAIAFLRRFNTQVFGHYPNATTIAEESTAWPMVSRPVDMGGLGFGYKWNMGWMNDTLELHQQGSDLSQASSRAVSVRPPSTPSTENFILPLSHDEVVHGKRSILGRMPGDEWQRFANLRAYYGFMFGHPGKKLLFMGSEFGQEREWQHDHSLDWHLLEHHTHAGVQALVRDLNALYRDVPALHELDCEARGLRMAGSRRRRPQRVRLVAQGPECPGRAAWSWSISRRKSIAIIASTCRSPAAGAKCSTPTQRSMAAPMPGTRGPSETLDDGPSGGESCRSPLAAIFLVPER